MVFHFPVFYESNFLIYSVSMWPGRELSRDPKRGSDAHQYFCHSVVWSVDDTWVSGASASRQLTLSQLIFSRWCLQSEGNRGCEEYCKWGVVGARTFPRVKKETVLPSIRNLWMSCKITRVSHNTDVCQSRGIADQSLLTMRRLQQHHINQWCQNFLILSPLAYFQHGPKNEDLERERRNLAEMDISAFPGSSPRASAGERETFK